MVTAATARVREVGAGTPASGVAVPELRALGPHAARPVSLAGQRVLPVLPPLAPLLPEEGLRRGSVVEVACGRGGGATSLALALVAGASRAGSWVAALGTGALAPAAAADLGVDLDRLALVPDPGPLWAVVAAALVDGVDALVVALPGGVGRRDARRLVARARERGAALVVLPDGRAGWPEGPDVRLEVVTSRWVGVGDGWGHLQARQVEVAAAGRRAAARERRARLWLPARGGAVAAVDPAADPVADPVAVVGSAAGPAVGHGRPGVGALPPPAPRGVPASPALAAVGS